MKKSFVILLTLTMPLFLLAQETTKQREVGLVFSNLDNFGLTYRTGSNKSLWRFNTMFISGNSSEETADSTVSTQSNAGFGIKIGKEYRKEIAQNFEFRVGADISFSYSKYKSELIDKSVVNHDRYREQTIFYPGINLVFGLNYVLSEKLVIGVEALPFFRYSTGTSKSMNMASNNDLEVKSDISGTSYGLSSSSALLSVSYRF